MTEILIIGESKATTKAKPLCRNIWSGLKKRKRNSCSGTIRVALPLSWPCFPRLPGSLLLVSQYHLIINNDNLCKLSFPSFTSIPSSKNRCKNKFIYENMNSELIQIHMCCCWSCFTKKKSDQFASADIKTCQFVPSHAKLFENVHKWM